MRVKTGADAAVWPTFLIAEDLEAGRISSNKILMLAPYGLDETAITGNSSRILLATFSGRQIYDLLSTAQAFFGENPIVQVSGMRYRFDPTSSPVILPSDIEIGGLPLDTTASYTLALDKNILYAASLLGIFPSSVDTSSYTVFSALREYIRDIWIVDYHSEGRITYKSLAMVEEGCLRNLSGSMDVYDIKELNFAKSGVYFVKSGGRIFKVIKR